MKINILMLLFVLTVMPFISHAAEVKNVKVSQVDDTAVATYDLVGGPNEQEAEVTVAIIVNGERRTSDRLSIKGDFGKGVKVGQGKKIIWNAMKDLPANFDGELSWEVRAIGVPQNADGNFTKFTGIRQIDFRSMSCDLCSSFKIKDDVLVVNGYGHLWTKTEMYDLKNGSSLLLETEFKLVDSSSELIIAFSENCLDWNSGKSDALTFNIIGDGMTRVRSNMYQNHVAYRQDVYVTLNQWQKLKIILSSQRIIAYLNSEEIMSVDLSNISFPQTGYIGLLGFRNVATEVRGLRVQL